MTRERKLRSEGTAIEYMNRRPAQQSSASKPSQGERAQMCLRNFEYTEYLVLANRNAVADWNLLSLDRLSLIENVILRCIHVNTQFIIVTLLACAVHLQSSNQIVFYLLKIGVRWIVCLNPYTIAVESFPFLNPIFLSLPNKYFQKMSKLLGLVLEKCVLTKELVKNREWFHAIINKKKS